MHRFGLCLRVALIGAALAGLSACAATSSMEQASRPVVQQVADARNGAEPVAPPAVAPAAAPAATPAGSTTVAELQDLIRNHQVNELRTTYNGSYGASLLFRSDELDYYVALFQQRDFWQVVKTKSAKQAEASYRAFADRTAELARIDFERIRLQAENARAEKEVNDRAARLSALQADHALRVQQDQQVASRQAQMQAETDRLSQQQQDVRAQLRDLQRQIDALQAEQGSLSTAAGSRPGTPKTARQKAESKKTVLQ